MTKNFALMLMAVLALGGLAACDDKTTTETTESSDVNGTVIERTVTTETESDGDNSSTETTIETTVDPEGLMNKETTTHESTETKEVE
jgi:uncharacterized lipoprotein YehR (DUF1307 family)